MPLAYSSAIRFIFCNPLLATASSPVPGPPPKSKSTVSSNALAGLLATQHSALVHIDTHTGVPFVGSCSMPDPVQESYLKHRSQSLLYAHPIAVLYPRHELIFYKRWNEIVRTYLVANRWSDCQLVTNANSSGPEI